MRYIKNKATVQRRIETFERFNRSQSTAWVDPFPEVHGTVPEKMVYAELTRLGIPFLFLNDLRFEIPEIGFDKWYQADFVIPSIKMIIEVQGAYWHSQPATMEADAYKLAIYEVSGWTARAWWDYQIFDDIHGLIAQEPSLLAVSNPGFRTASMELPVQRRSKVDTSKGIRTLNARRFKPKMVKSKRKELRKAIGLYS